jgi:hypothetical protein
MESVTSIAGVAFIVLLVVLLVIGQQIQQNAQYRAIHQRLEEIRNAELREEKARKSRAERTAAVERLNILENEYSVRGGSLTEEELKSIDMARDKIKTVNAELVREDQWLGAPFDLEWAELFDRVPLLKGAYLADTLRASNEMSEQSGEPLIALPNSSAETISNS